VDRRSLFEAKMANPIPEKIGKYEVIGRLGQGGMGTVYKAHDPILDRLVAIKILAGGLTDDPAYRQRFYREAQATANLRHPNIVTIYDLGEHEERPYLVMEYLEGHTLDGSWSWQGFELAQKLNVVIGVCHGLQHAHQRGVVHRDIKPGNVMVLGDGTPKIVDFGLAHIAQSGDRNLTRTGQIMGSLNYMSPEQVQGLPGDPRSDIFSTGVVLYELVTGNSPFKSDNDFETLSKVLKQEPPSMGKFLLGYPPGLETVTAKAMAKRPEDRYETAADLAQDLSRLRDSGPLPYEIRPGLLKDAPSPPPPTPQVSMLSQPAPASGEFTRVLSPPPTKILASDAAAGSEPQAERPPLASDFTRMFESAPTGVELEHALPQVRLTFTASNDGLLVGKSVLVKSVPFRIGRNADLSIGDVHLSRTHAVIDWDGKSFTIADLGSTNGTFLNGRQLRNDPQRLPFGGVIRLGTATVLTFSSDEISELPDLTGQTIADRYELAKLLRNGAMTALYEASDSHLPQKVAVKILSPSLAGYPGYLEHFNREAETAVHLRHPHICRVLDYGRASVRMAGRSSVLVNYLSMELMEGGSMTDRVANKSRLEVSQIVSWLNDVTNALESVHRQGVTHGGLKLSSIVFDREGEPYVSDFGMASRVDDHAKPLFIGSPEFLAPEQWEGAVPTPMADQYSVAVIAYLLLTGSCPFEGQLDPKVRQRNFLHGPVPVDEEAARMARPAVPPRTSEVLKRALSVKPADRYASVREFFLALNQTVTNPSSHTDGRPRIFISYQRDPSSGWAVHFASELERKHRIVAFVDTQRLDSAVRFPTRLKNAIKDCDVFVCLLSGSTLQSKWVQEEIRLAWENNKPMVPVFQESYAQPDPSEHLEPHIETLINYDGLQLLDRRNLYVEHTIDKLAEMVTATVRKINP
jgi:serine/threonine-protein kinase